MDKELAEYRARKAQELKKLSSSKTSDHIIEKTNCGNNVDCAKSSVNENSQLEAESSDFKKETLDLRSRGPFDWLLVSLQVLLWFSLWMLFVKLEFGSVYIVVSGLYVLWRSLRTSGRIRKKGELSAYSVFNPNFEVLDGTLTAEQFDKEIRHAGL